MALPKTIKVGPYDIKVEVITKPVMENRGEYHDGIETIYINNNPEMQKWKETNVILHEIFHVVYHLGHLKDSSDEENVVDVFATWMAMVFRDNPDLAKYILNEGKK